MKLTRRQFAKSGIAAAFLTLCAGIIAIPKRMLSNAKPLPKKFGYFDIAEDGTLSLDGQSHFQVYGVDGGLAFETVSYRYKDGKIIETHWHMARGRMRDSFEGNMGRGTGLDRGRERVVWTEKDGGIF